MREGTQTYRYNGLYDYACAVVRALIPIGIRNVVTVTHVEAPATGRSLSVLIGASNAVMLLQEISK
jgi:hypothetical protein